MTAKGQFDYSTDDRTLAGKVEEGVPVMDVVAFGRSSGFTLDELAKLLRIPPRTYARRVATKTRLKIGESDRAVRIMRLFDRARRVFGTQARTRQWLHRPLRVLGGRTPLDFAQTEPGAREVEAVLDRFEDGTFS